MATAAPSATRGRGGNENRSSRSSTGRGCSMGSPKICHKQHAPRHPPAQEREEKGIRGRRKETGERKKETIGGGLRQLVKRGARGGRRIQRNRTKRARPAEDSAGLPAGNVSLIQRLCLNDKSSGLPAN